jgi:flagellin
MPQIINTNMASLNAQRNLNSSQNSLATALTRLSSGLRINSAKDDAAGLAISDRFTTQIRGLNQAVRNANDGISLSQTGEGALAEVSNNLQRIRELAVQAANATNSDSDRAALDLEVQQRLAEVDRIASQTNFNGRKILDGSFGNASFQVGADAGQTIVLNLEGSTRVADIGAIASATSGALGASAVDGHIDVTPTDMTFFGSGTPATAGSIQFTGLADFDFTPGATLVAGTSAPFVIDETAVGGLDFSTPAVLTAAAYTTSAPVTSFDFSLSAGVDGHMEITDDGGTFSIPLDGQPDFGSGANLAAYLTGELAAAGSNTTVTWDVDHLVLTSAETGSASVAPTFTSGADLVAAGITLASTNSGVDASAATSSVINIDGTNVTLDFDALGSGAVLASGLTGAMAGAGLVGYSANYDAGTGELTITGPDENSVDLVVNNTTGVTAFAAGFTTSAGVAGSAAVVDQSATFIIDSHAVTLDSNYFNIGGLASALQAKMGSGYTFSTSGTGDLLIERTSVGASSTGIAITAADGNAVLAGLGVGDGVSTDGVDAFANNNATFYVDGNVVNLTTDFLSYADLATEIGTQLSGYSASYDGGTGQITISKDGSIDAVNITGADVIATTAGFGFASGVVGSSAGSITLAAGDYSIAVGDADPVDFAGTYASPQELATAINRELSGINAEITPAGELKLMSTQQITMSGAEAGATGAMAFTTLVVAPTAGSLDTVNVMDVISANEAIVRIDSALTGVSNLRSTFGAIQNRFESTISNLTATGENLTSARSRIMDADFAQETAALTRAQILQQAGTAMLAQANQIPQNVLSLLG